MAEKGNLCRVTCGCLACCWLFILCAIVLGLLFGLVGIFFMAGNFLPCYSIANQQPYIMDMKNVTLKQGHQAQVACEIVNYDHVKRVYWINPNFQAWIEPEQELAKTFTPQASLHALPGLTSATFYCQAEKKLKTTVSVPVKTFTLFFNPIKVEHEGWYACVTNVTGTIIGKKFYLSVE